MKTFEEAGFSVPSSSFVDSQGNTRISCPVCTPGRKREHQRERDLSVNVHKGTWFCHHVGCDFAGGLEDYPGWPGGAPKTQSVAFTPQSARSRVWEAPRPLQKRALPSLWQQALDWFHERGISEDTAKQLRCTAALEFCPVCKEQTLHILYPYFINGRHTNTKHRCVHKHFRMERGAELSLWNLNHCKDADVVYLVEGEMDVMACVEAGRPLTLSVPNGAALTGNGPLDYLLSAETLLASATRIVLATDADEPGQTLMFELARRFGLEKCGRVIWPDGIKDANDALTLVGPDFLRDLLDNAEPFPIAGLTTGEDVVAELEYMYHHGLSSGTRIGYPIHFDSLFRIEPGFLTIVTGIPSHGKSTVLDNLLVTISRNHDWRIAYYSPEQHPVARHQKALIEMFIGKSMLPGNSRRMELHEMREANAWLADRFSFIDPDDDDYTLSNILRLATKEVFRRGIKALVLDPYNQFTHTRKSGEDLNEYVARFCGEIRRWARTHNVHVFLVVHPGKMGIDTETGKEKVPTLENALGASAFRAVADMGLTVWRDTSEDSDRFQVITTKIRWKELGKLGTAHFAFDYASGRIYELAS